MNHNLNQPLENKYINVDESDIAEVIKALKRNQLAGTAEVVVDYESELKKYFKTKHALAVSNGTSALHLLLYVYDVSPGDEVIVPSTAPIMSALPILAIGATPIFVDTNVENFAYDDEDLANKISSRTKAIVTVPMWGYPINLENTKKVAKEKKVPIIEDASHCHGSKLANKFVGSMTEVGFFSTQERKLIATGEGGFILTNDDFIADRVREVRDFGKPVRDSEEFKGFKGKYGLLFGLNFRLSAMSAALGISQVQKINNKINKRTQNAQKLINAFKNFTWIKEIEILPNSTPNYYSIVFFINHQELSAQQIGEDLYSKKIVSDTYRFGIKPLYELPLFSKYKTSCINSEVILKNIITLPTHEGLNDEEIDYIIECVSKYN